MLLFHLVPGLNATVGLEHRTLPWRFDLLSLHWRWVAVAETIGSRYSRAELRRHDLASICQLRTIIGVGPVERVICL